MSQGTIRIGTSGFSYKDWLGNFYPQFCPAADFLKFYTSVFNTVEIDATFYRIPSDAVVKRWSCQSRDRFVFAAKFPRSVTHEGEPNERVKSATAFIEVMRGLGERLGPLLMQFPYSFKPDGFPLLERLVTAMPDDVRIAVEVRNKAWLNKAELFELLRSKNIALVLIDHPWMPKQEIATADFHYLRFLGDRKRIPDDFSHVRIDREDDLCWWRDVIARLTADGRELFAFFNNHYSGHSPSTAKRMIELLNE
jgi:uncharacterized protein YecE (DUF72 family)